MVNEIEALMTVKEAAAFLGRSPSWLFQALQRDPGDEGSIPHVRLPGRRGGCRFEREELLSWLRAGSPPAAIWRDMQARRVGRRRIGS